MPKGFAWKVGGRALFFGNNVPGRSIASISLPTSGLVARWESRSGYTQGLSQDGTPSTWVDTVGGLTLESNGTSNPSPDVSPTGAQTINIGLGDGMTETGIGSIPSGSSARTLALVFNPVLDNGAFAGFGYGTNVQNQAFTISMNNSNNIQLDFFNNTAGAGFAATGDWVVVFAEYSGTTARLFNGTTQVDSSVVALNTGTTQVNLCESFSGNTTLAEVAMCLVYNKVLSASEKQEVIDYANQVFLNDNLPVTLSGTTLSNATSVTLDYLFEVSRPASYNWVLTTSATVPSAAQIQAGEDHTGSAATAIGAGTTTTFTQSVGGTITGLSAGTTYYLHAYVSDGTNTDIESSAGQATDAADVTAPTLSGLAVSPTSTGADITVTTTEANGTYFYTVAGTEETSSATIIGGADASGTVNTTTISFSVSGLTASTTYWINICHRDASGNVSSTATTTQFTTSASATWPRLVWNDVGHTPGTLTDYTGSSDITGTTVVLENFRFTSELRQQPTCTSLTIRNCHFDMDGDRYGFQDRWTESPSGSTVIEDCTFEGCESSAVIFGGSGSKTLLRCQFRDNKTDHIKFFGSGNKTITSCYFGGLSRTQNYPTEDFHADVFQNTCSGTNTVQGCTWDAPPGGNDYLGNSFEGRFSQVTSGSWLETDAIAAGFTPPVWHRGTIAYFAFNGDSSTTNFLNNHFYRIPRNGIQKKDDVNAACTFAFTDNLFYPSGVRVAATGTSFGTWTDNGGNVWAENGTDLEGISRTAGTNVFSF